MSGWLEVRGKASSRSTDRENAVDVPLTQVRRPGNSHRTGLCSRLSRAANGSMHYFPSVSGTWLPAGRSENAAGNFIIYSTFPGEIERLGLPATRNLSNDGDVFVSAVVTVV